MTKNPEQPHIPEQDDFDVPGFDINGEIWKKENKIRMRLSSGEYRVGTITRTYRKNVPASKGSNWVITQDLIDVIWENGEKDTFSTEVLGHIPIPRV